MPAGISFQIARAKYLISKAARVVSQYSTIKLSASLVSNPWSERFTRKKLVKTGGHRTYWKNLHFPELYMVEILRCPICCRRNFKKGSFKWKLKGLVPLINFKNSWRATNPPPKPYPQTHPIKF